MRDLHIERLILVDLLLVVRVPADHALDCRNNILYICMQHADYAGARGSWGLVVLEARG